MIETMKTMTPEVYENKRNELIALLGEVIKDAPAIEGKTRDELDATIDRLKRNSFEIVLVGEFQGGKSTTFNAMCGREISPMGIGIKTSACKISAQAIAADQEEYVELRWKTDEELTETIWGLLVAHYSEDPEALKYLYKSSWDLKENDPLFSPLSDVTIYDLAEKALASEWENYERNKTAYKRERLEILKIATPMLQYCRSKELKKLRKQRKVSIEALKHLVAFPLDWDSRWSENSGQTKWSFNEIIFAFLGEVQCYIHCDNLERLGCVITDCPGLFAGPWDSKVAQEAMMGADAILYLLRGDKTTGEKELEVLKHIHNGQQEHKLFFALNAKGCSKAHPTNLVGNTSIRREVVTAIKACGVEIENESELPVFNPFLAFASRCKSGNGQKLGKVLTMYLDVDVFDSKQMANIHRLLSDRDALYHASDFPSILDRVEAFIISHKARSILITHGSGKVMSALNELRSNLMRKEKLAAETKEIVEREVQIRRERLKNFQQLVLSGVQTIVTDQISRQIVVDDFFKQVYMNRVNDYTTSIVSVVEENFNSENTALTTLVKGMAKALKTNKEQRGEIIRDTVLKSFNWINVIGAEALRNNVELAISGWLTNVLNGKNRAFKETYEKKIYQLKEFVLKKWKEELKDDQLNFLGGLSFDFPLEVFLPSIDDSQVDAKNVGKAIGGTLCARVLIEIGTYVAAMVSTIITSVIITQITMPGIGAIISALLGMIVAVPILVAGEKLNNFIGKKLTAYLSKKLPDLLRNNFYDQKETIVANAEDALIVKMVQSMNSSCIDEMERQSETFERHVDEALKQKSLAQEKQQQIAKEAEEVRVSQIEPVQARVETFHEGLKEYLTI